MLNKFTFLGEKKTRNKFGFNVDVDHDLNS